MQRVIPFKTGGFPTVFRVPLDVGTQGTYVVRGIFASTAELGQENDVVGWFNQELTTTEAAKYVDTAQPDFAANWDFMSGIGDIEVPPGTAFMTVYVSVGGRGVFVIEPRDKD